MSENKDIVIGPHQLTIVVKQSLLVEIVPLTDGGFMVVCDHEPFGFAKGTVALEKLVQKAMGIAFREIRKEEERQAALEVPAPKDDKK